MNYRTEFPDFVLDVAIPAEWVDTSWHNDACPSWQTPNGFRVYVDYLEPERRDIPTWPRFSIGYADVDVYNATHPSTDTWQEVLDYVATHAGKTSEAALSAEYEAWLAAQGLTLGSADEHLTDPQLSEAQRQWLFDFVKRWEA